MVCGCNLENKNVLVPSHISEYNFNVNSKDKSRVRVKASVNVIANVRVDVGVNVSNSDAMYVITFANPKGGSGKTTSAMLLAEQIALSGGSVAIIDLDPNANILIWSESRKEQGRAVPFTVHARPQAEETVELIDKLSGDVDYLIIDL